ncbi:MAG: hypothetical protein REI09_03835 [Candidatus Dactylopiibacterium sp.]|nr:hypothetical protein [Candidatus Dactylopiibacterium sp.]
MKGSVTLAACLFGIACGTVGATEQTAALRAQIGRLFDLPRPPGSAPPATPEARPSPSSAGLPAAPGARTLRLDGVLLRPDGRHTVWINHNALSGAAAPVADDVHSVWLRSGRGAMRRLRPGESLSDDAPVDP